MAFLSTTKKGQEGRTSVDVSSSMLFETPLVTPKFQNTYGANAEFYDDTSLNPNEATQAPFEHVFMGETV